MLSPPCRPRRFPATRHDDLTDDDVLKVLAKESKKRGESAEIYTENGRGELAAKERAEAQIIDEYLPTPLTDEELSTSSTPRSLRWPRNSVSDRRCGRWARS